MIAFLTSQLTFCV